MVRRFVVVTLGLLGIVLGVMGLEWADQHEPTLANALAGRQLYSDAGTIRVLSAILVVAMIVLLVWEFVRKRHAAR